MQKIIASVKIVATAFVVARLYCVAEVFFCYYSSSAFFSYSCVWDIKQRIKELSQLTRRKTRS
jgi:hypothetical protein